MRTEALPEVGAAAQLGHWRVVVTDAARQWVDDRDCIKRYGRS